MELRYIGTYIRYTYIYLYIHNIYIVNSNHETLCVVNAMLIINSNMWLLFI